MRFALALALAASPLPAQQPAPAPAPATAPTAPAAHDFKLITLQRSDTGAHFFVEATVDGRDTRLLVDSASTGLFFISRELSDALGKKTARTEGAPPEAPPAAVFGDVFIGQSIRLKNQTLPVADLPMLPQLTLGGKPAGAQGLVGSVFLRGVRGAFDYGKGVILYPKAGVPKGAFRQARERRGDLILPLTEGASAFPYLTIRLKGKDFEFLLDTASALTTIEPAVAKELGLETTKSGNSATSLERAEVPKVWLARQEAGAMEFFLSASPAAQTVPKGKRFGGVVGSRFLSRLEASLDFDTYSLVFPKAGTPQPEAPKEK